jgi:hypothetical protein
MTSRLFLFCAIKRALPLSARLKPFVCRACFLTALATSIHLTNAHAAVSINEVQQHQFPDAVASSKTGRLIVTWKGALGNVVNTQVVSDYWSNGEFVLQSDSSSTITVNIYSNQDIPGVTLKTIKFRYQGKTYKTFPVSGLPNPGPGSKARLGMRILFTKNVEPGQITPSYTIEVTDDNP